MGHSVKMHAQVYELTKAGTAVTFEVYNDEGKLGEIRIGKGSFGWKGANQREFRPIDWTRFFAKIGDITPE